MPACQSRRRCVSRCVSRCGTGSRFSIEVRDRRSIFNCCVFGGDLANLTRKKWGNSPCCFHAQPATAYIIKRTNSYCKHLQKKSALKPPKSGKRRKFLPSQAFPFCRAKCFPFAEPSASLSAKNIKARQSAKNDIQQGAKTINAG